MSGPLGSFAIWGGGGRLSLCGSWAVLAPAHQLLPAADPRGLGADPKAEGAPPLAPTRGLPSRLAHTPGHGHAPAPVPAPTPVPTPGRQVPPLGDLGLRLQGCPTDPQGSPSSPPPTGAVADPAPQEATQGPAPAPGPSHTPQEGDVGRGPGAPLRRKISVLTVQ